MQFKNQNSWIHCLFVSSSFILSSSSESITSTTAHPEASPKYRTETLKTCRENLLKRSLPLHDINETSPRDRAVNTPFETFPRGSFDSQPRISQRERRDVACSDIFSGLAGKVYCKAARLPFAEGSFAVSLTRDVVGRSRCVPGMMKRLPVTC